AWPRVFAVMLSCAVAALALDSATAAFARMGENAATTKLVWKIHEALAGADQAVEIV
ncbi:MAG: hypothetical protein K0Q60_4594, partial [Microvirga sp.]|nr:hypothetical protein [Microvirga sp.]